MEELYLPERLFAVGHIPDGERVTAYHRAGQIKTILATLDEEEAEKIRKSSWGKFIATAEKPGFYGRFVRYVMERQLKMEELDLPERLFSVGHILDGERLTAYHRAGQIKTIYNDL